MPVTDTAAFCATHHAQAPCLQTGTWPRFPPWIYWIAIQVLSMCPVPSHSATCHPTHPGGGCWTCAHWHGGATGNGGALVCEQDPDYHMVQASPDTGCCRWEREPGADDEILYRSERENRGWLFDIWKPRRR